MNKYIAIALIFVFSAVLYSQEKESSVIRFLKKRGYVSPQQILSNRALKPNPNWPDIVFYDTPYTCSLLGSPTLPLTFSRIEFKGADYKLGTTMSLGYGYTWFVGDFRLERNGKILVDPQFFFGVAADIGLKNDFNSDKVTAGATLGCFAGIKSFSVFGGYDILAKSWTVGIGTRIDIFTLSQESVIPFGKVSSLSEIESDAIPVEFK